MEMTNKDGGVFDILLQNHYFVFVALLFDQYFMTISIPKKESSWQYFCTC